MVVIKRTLKLSLTVPLLLTCTHVSHAQDNGLFIPAVYNVQADWKTNKDQFSNVEQNYNAPAEALNTQNASALSEDLNVSQSAQSFSSDNDSSGKQLEKQILDMIPYKNTARHTWRTLKGDEDLGVEGLRVDAGNLGLLYETLDMPILGKTEGTKLTAEVGKKQRLTFESDYMPTQGRIEGLKFKAGFENGGAQIGFRYNKKFDPPKIFEYKSVYE